MEGREKIYLDLLHVPKKEGSENMVLNLQS